MIDRNAIYHTSSHTYAYAASGALRVRLRTEKGLENARVFYKNVYDHTSPFDCAEMERILSDGMHDYFEAEIRVKEKRYKYYFEIESGGERTYYTSDGFVQSPDSKNCFYVPYTNPDDEVAVPEWARGEIIYQVLVDRFHDGDPANNPEGTAHWNAEPDGSTYYGGDFEGLKQKLGYIRGLGARIIYLSPVLKSPTYHKYDVSDYYAVEEIYGGERGLKELTDSAHALGLKVVLDGVFNHCSWKNPLFLDVVEKGADSPYADWFNAESFPVDLERANYENFAGIVPSMPRFNTSNPNVADYLISSAEHWTRRIGIDGWRLDVADEVAHSFWRKFRTRLTAANPDILILGEIWNFASQWLLGDELHTATNYKFMRAALRLAEGKLTAQGFMDALDASKAQYKTPVHGVLVNLLGSHDTERIFTAAEDEETAFLCIAAMLLLDGMPLIYYGDEAGMRGGNDPACRAAMRWELTKTPLAERIASLMRLRSASAALKLGSTQRCSFCGGGLLAFTREYGGEKLTAVLNFGDKSAAAPLSGEQILGNALKTEGGFELLPKGYSVII